MKLLCIVLLFAPTAAFTAEIKLPAVFADQMVLQREQSVPVWGWGKAGAEVTVSFAGQTKNVVADASGNWSVKLGAMNASSEPRTMTITSSVGGETRTINEVLVGEVWLCAGQSNMAMTVDGQTKWLHVGGIANAKDVVQNSANPLLRQFLVDWKTETRPQADCTGKWMIAGPDSTANFSATGYYFARELQQRLKVPVGILNASFGGASVEGWTSREALAKHSDAEFVGQMDKLISDYENHEQLVTEQVAAAGKWEAAHDRADPKGSEDDAL
jgi:sialate O-acetylesterase